MWLTVFPQFSIPRILYTARGIKLRVVFFSPLADFVSGSGLSSNFFVKFLSFDKILLQNIVIFQETIFLCKNFGKLSNFWSKIWISFGRDRDLTSRQIQDGRRQQTWASLSGYKTSSFFKKQFFYVKILESFPIFEAKFGSHLAETGTWQADRSKMAAVNKLELHFQASFLW